MTVLTVLTVNSFNVPALELSRLCADLFWCYQVVFALAHVNVNDFFSNLALITTLVDININFLSAKLRFMCVQFFL